MGSMIKQAGEREVPGWPMVQQRGALRKREEKEQREEERERDSVHTAIEKCSGYQKIYSLF